VQLAVLFWFYRDPVLCQNRLRLLRRRNRGVAIYGLYGGPPERAATFARALAPLLDDFWAYPDDIEASWKWRNGDLVLTRWFVDRGEGLAWDSVFVAQWDMVLTARLSHWLPPMQRDDMLLSGLRPISEVERWWQWTSREPGRTEYEAFMAHVVDRYGKVEDPKCCQSIGMVIPRRFFERYRDIDDPELGFLEYKMPVYAQLFGLRLLPDTCFAPFWPEDPDGPTRRNERLVHAWASTVRLPVVLAEAWRPGGRRVFHPYHGIYPHDLRSLPDAFRHRRERREQVATTSRRARST
jgi:hypothetical protein